MIDVHEVVRGIPHFDKFCSVSSLHALVERLSQDSRFEVRTAGQSRAGIPIHHVRTGRGPVKALIVAYPHCKEPIGGLTVYSLLTLLLQANPALRAAEVEWHIVPCIDPDGALLNEGWTQSPVTMERYMRNFYVQALRDQVDGSFPLRHKRLHWSRPSTEARVLQGLLDRVRPDFFYSLHNAWTGGAFYYLSQDIGERHRQQLYRLLEDLQFPLQTRPIWSGVCRPFDTGIVEMWSVKKHYDQLEARLPEPEKQFAFGAASWDYLAEIKPGALTLVAEMGYVRHPDDESSKPTSGNLRQFKLRLDADSKYLASVLLDEWHKVKDELDRSSPLYTAVLGGAVLPDRGRLNDGGRPLAMQPTEELLLNSFYDRLMTEGDRFQACMVEGGFWFLCHSYQFVRLLKASRQTPGVARAIERAESAFEDALGEIRRHVDFEAFRLVDHDTLARVQLGSGLVALNSVLERQ